MSIRLRTRKCVSVWSCQCTSSGSSGKQMGSQTLPSRGEWRAAGWLCVFVAGLKDAYIWERPVRFTVRNDNEVRMYLMMSSGVVIQNGKLGPVINGLDSFISSGNGFSLQLDSPGLAGILVLCVHVDSREKTRKCWKECERMSNHISFNFPSLHIHSLFERVTP